MANNPMAKSNKLPFRQNTRQRIQDIGTQTFVPGARLTFELPRVGFLAAIQIWVSGTLLWDSHEPPYYSGVFADTKWNFLNRIGVNLNIGSASIWDTSGHGAYLMNNTIRNNFSPDLGSLIPQIPQSNGNGTLSCELGSFYGNPVSNNPDTSGYLGMAYYLPISANNGRNFNMGLINLQAPEVRCTLDLQCGQLSDLYPAGTNLTHAHLTNVTVNVHYIYYEVPNPAAVMFPPLVLHRTLEERTPFASVGDVVYTVPRQGSLLRLMHNVRINGANSEFVNRFTLKVNKSDDVYRMSAHFLRYWNRLAYGHTMPFGAFVYDFWNAEEQPSVGDFRDVIDSEAISTLESIVTVNSDATLGIGNNFVDTIREIVQVLQV